jgi:hypothetical protein
MGRLTDEFGVPEKEYINDDLVTGTPITEKKPFNLAIFFEWVKLIQRVIMVILTSGLIYVMLQANVEMKGMKVEMQRISNLTEKALDIAEVTRLDIMRQIEEIQKDGIDLHVKMW